MQDRLGGIEWGGMDKRRVEGIADEKRCMERRLPVLFLGCACTGKRRVQLLLDIRRPDSAALVHATHIPIFACTRCDGIAGKWPKLCKANEVLAHKKLVSAQKKGLHMQALV